MVLIELVYLPIRGQLVLTRKPAACGRDPETNEEEEMCHVITVKHSGG